MVPGVGGELERISQPVLPRGPCTRPKDKAIKNSAIGQHWLPLLRAIGDIGIAGVPGRRAGGWDTADPVTSRL